MHVANTIKMCSAQADWTLLVFCEPMIAYDGCTFLLQHYKLLLYPGMNASNFILLKQEIASGFSPFCFCCFFCYSITSCFFFFFVCMWGDFDLLLFFFPNCVYVCCVLLCWVCGGGSGWVVDFVFYGF